MIIVTFLSICSGIMFLNMPFFLCYIMLTLLFNCLIYNFQTTQTIKSTISEEDFEKIYITYILTAQDHQHTNSACALEKSKKIALCLHILSQKPYENDNIYQNMVAYFVNSVKCKENPVRFKNKIFFLDETVSQEMFPCYGRHNPVRTDFRTDDNYDKYYISSGWNDNSIFLYIHEFDFTSDQYIVHSHYSDINFVTIEASISIRIQEIANELNLNQETVFTNYINEIEVIYMREKENRVHNDKISLLKDNDKATVCNFILNQKSYREIFDFSLQIDAFNIFEDMTVKNKLRIHLKHKTDVLIIQRMVPCYSQIKEGFYNPSKNIFFNFIHISEGPRQNSIFVYVKNTDVINMLEYILYDFIENIVIERMYPKIDTRNPTDEHISSATGSFMISYTNLMNIKGQYFEIKLRLEEDFHSKILQIKKNLELHWKQQVTKKLESKINQIFVKVNENLHSIIHQNIIDDANKNYVKRKESFILDEVELLKETKILEKQVLRLEMHTSLDVRYKIKGLKILLNDIQLKMNITIN